MDIIFLINEAVELEAVCQAVKDFLKIFWWIFLMIWV